MLALAVPTVEVNLGKAALKALKAKTAIMLKHKNFFTLPIEKTFYG
jgi:hypothetical protein